MDFEAMSNITGIPSDRVKVLYEHFRDQHGLPATQPWVHQLSIMKQSVLMSAIRGPDNVPKYHRSKYLIRWYRRCVLMSALDRDIIPDPVDPRGGSFTGPSINTPDNNWQKHMEVVVVDYIQSLDELPLHFVTHFLHAIEILGYDHEDDTIREWWRALYLRLVKDLHLEPETREQLNRRLGDNEKWWREANDPATTD